ncbi:MAG: FAD:protein FMN transferase [Alphaproteobacteria bacterium]|nr:FAD:protein FMN transferase [Alphaproteobacteria bacterium]
MIAEAPIPDRQAAPRLTRSGPDFLYLFHAMATPCEVRLETEDQALAMAVAETAETEVRRIERKFSRYRSDSVVGKINASGGGTLAVDAETASLINFADRCHQLSGGLFDITSGVLRRIWRFDGSDRVPAQAQVKAMRFLVGWKKVRWEPPAIMLPAGMEIDLGGLAKEYAVDRTLAVIARVTQQPALVNFGGDLRVSGPRRQGGRWKVAIESVEAEGHAAGLIELADGALATSGDARRFLLKDGVRYGHILNPRTCMPVEHAPRSVTVAAPTCIEAGMTATMAILNGKQAETFLEREGVRAWCIR